MSQNKFKLLTVACVAAALFLSASASEAGPFFPNGFRCGLFGWRCRGRDCQQCAPACAPVAACNPCATAQYVPQTAYRREMVSIPMTCYQPVRSIDPCTGCQVCTMRPVTTYVRRAQCVPYTTYRIVYSSAPRATCPTGCGQLAVSSPCGTGGCPTGGCGTTPTPYYTPGPTTVIPGASTPGFGETTRPTLVTPPTFVPQPGASNSAPAIQLQQRPIEGGMGIQSQDATGVQVNPAAGPQFLDPNARTTWIPAPYDPAWSTTALRPRPAVRQAVWQISEKVAPLVSQAAPAPIAAASSTSAAALPKVDHGGWHAARPRGK